MRIKSKIVLLPLVLVQISFIVVFGQNSLAQTAKADAKSCLSREAAIQLSDEEMRGNLEFLNQYHESNLLELSYFEKKVEEGKLNSRSILTIQYRFKKEMKGKYDEYAYENYKFEVVVYYNPKFSDSTYTAKNMADSLNYKITITNYYFGREKDMTIVENGTITTKTNLLRTSNSVTIDKIALSDSEIYRMNTFLKQFPILKLKTSYIDENVEDGTQIRFRFQLGNKEKEIFVSNFYQEDLGKLTKLIASLLGEDFIRYYEHF
ncbi:MAG: hypothetical protein KKD31_16090 [Bacteroidetes bacterium]|nr:hypothetical protein [Bacteroidota bacterium]